VIPKAKIFMDGVIWSSVKSFPFHNPVAAAEALEALRAEMDNENMEDHENVYLPNGDGAHEDLWDDMEYWEDVVNYFEEGY
jgi:hypothetical protein